MGREVLASIRTQYPSFTPVERTIADYVLNHGAEVVRLPIRQLAYECAVGESSIVRFCKRVGQKGYPDFRLSLAAALEMENVPAEKAENTSLIGVADEIYQQHQQSLFNARNMLNAETLQNIAAHMLAARQIYFFAPAGLQSQAIQLGLMTMQATGKGIGLAAPYPQALCQREIGAEDMVIFLVTSAQTGALADTARQLRDRGAYLISISCCGQSAIQNDCQENLFYGGIAGSPLPDSAALFFIVETLCAVYRRQMEERESAKADG